MYVYIYIYIYLLLLEQINNKTTLVKEQFGFRSKLLTFTAIYSLISEIFIALNNKNIIRGTFCDHTKAFYCVNHGISLSKNDSITV